ncbi:MAG: hypothetical protein K0S44_2124 [Bacteroidetes bacterium]|jgi:hypothetical protein|nr:hypothetical protein [Bacteroidota bacterium]
MTLRKLCLFLIAGFLSCVQLCYAQTTTVVGFIKEKGSNEPIPFVHVFFKGTQVGSTSDTSGYFTISIENDKIKEDSIVVSSLGYNTVRLSFKRNEKQKIDVEIIPQYYQLNELVVKPGENPAWRVMRMIIANKEKNAPKTKSNYYCEEYSKIRFDLNHFTDKLKKNILVKPFDFIWKNVDTTSDGIVYLPVLLIEKVVDHYYQRSPYEQKDYVKAINSSGLEGPKIMKFVEDLYQAPDFYNNYVAILDKNFAGPLNDNYKVNYKFYLTDSIYNEQNKKIYKITFIPKQKRELAFTGEMLIDSADAALKEITVRFDIMANVNFVRSFWIHQEYNKINDKDWMLTNSDVIGDFTVIENSSDLTGFFGRKNAAFTNYSVDTTLDKGVFKGTAIVVESDSAKLRTDEYWKNSRKLTFTEEDEGVIKMDDTLKRDPRFIIREKIIKASTSGYYPLNGIDIGDIYTFYSYNNIEKSRFKLGFRTNDKLKIPFGLSAYAAYGTFDEKWKYKINPELHFGEKKHLKSKLGFSYKDDIEQLSRSINNIELDHILASFIQVGTSDASKNYVRDLNAYIENNWTTGLTTRLNYFYNILKPVKGLMFESYNHLGEVEQTPEYLSAGFDITVKYSWQNKNMDGRFYTKRDMKNSFRKYPDIALQWKISDKSFGGKLNFQKAKISFKQEIRTQKLGYFKYYVEAGKTFNTVPYPYLDLPFANQLIVLDESAFNLMNFLEYAADEYVSIHLEQHIEGLLLDRIPIINRLKWRNFIFAKGYLGNMSKQNNQEIYLFPKGLNKLNEPYYEVGFGIENIFKISRVDFVWRLSDIKPGAYYFMVKPSFKFSF